MTPEREIVRIDMRDRPGLPSRNRPKLCAVCHKPATWSITDTTPSKRLDRAGRMETFPMHVSTFYCDEHQVPR